MIKEIPEVFTPWYGGDSITYRVIEEERPKVEIPEGFTPWNGMAFPVSPETEVKVVYADGSTDSGAARDLPWVTKDESRRIIAYRVIEEEKPKVEIPKGFTPWSGGECPVDLSTKVEVILSNGKIAYGDAGFFRWNAILTPPLLAYRASEEEKTQRANDIQIGGNHYKDAGVQPWEVVDTWPLDQRIGFYRGNALKYTMRMGTKDEQLTEIKKAQHYLQKLVEVLEEQKGGA